MTDAASVDWDAIVIGTGMGGGTVGRALAEAGFKVLFVEKGPAGQRAERHSMTSDISDPTARSVRGMWPDPMVGSIDGREVTFFGPIGTGLGGSSVFYAATLERPERHDLETVSGRPHPVDGWPIGYDMFRPWLEKAEDLFEVAGDPDPLSSEPPPSLRPPHPVTPAESALMEAFGRAGLHPYRQHAAVRAVDGCLNCFGSKCPRPCKMDGRSAGVEPALATGRAALLVDCEVTRICGDEGRVTHLEARRGGDAVTLKARAYVLASGAFGSPRLLLASATEEWPQGCANESGLVGRNLMFHLHEILALWPPAGARPDAPTRALALRDLYFYRGDRMGMVQSMGISVGYGVIVSYLDTLLARRGLTRLNPLARPMAAVAARALGEAQVFSCLLEDFANSENRVLPAERGSDRLKFVYHLSDEIAGRRKRFRRRLLRALPGRRKMFLNQAPEPNFGHGCGTLRFGRDPATSVLDPTCRAHGLANLWVADASFMPSSTGVNPSLTIAANALRVAAAVVEARP